VIEKTLLALLGLAVLAAFVVWLKSLNEKPVEVGTKLPKLRANSRLERLGVRAWLHVLRPKNYPIQALKAYARIRIAYTPEGKQLMFCFRYNPKTNMTCEGGPLYTLLVPLERIVTQFNSGASAPFLWQGSGPNAMIYVLAKDHTIIDEIELIREATEELNSELPTTS